MSQHDNLINSGLKWFHLLTTILSPLAIWLVEWSEVRIWQHQFSELVEFSNSRILFMKECYPGHLMLKHSEIDGMKIIRYDNECPGNAFHIPEDAFWGFIHLMFHILSSVPSLCLITLCCEDHLLEAEPIDTQLPWQQIAIFKQLLQCFKQ